MIVVLGIIEWVIFHLLVWDRVNEFLYGGRLVFEVSQTNLTQECKVNGSWVFIYLFIYLFHMWYMESNISLNNKQFYTHNIALLPIIKHAYT